MYKPRIILQEMKNIYHAAMAFLLFAFLFAAPTQIAAQTGGGAKPSALFKDVWVDYDVEQDGEKGMTVHVKFTVYGMKNLPSYLAIYFETAEGVRLRDKDRSYNSTSGEVAVYRELNPGYATTDYNDLTLFMPYDQLDLGDGDWDLRMDIDVIYKAGGLIQHLAYKEFNFKQGDDVEPETPAETEKTAKVDRIWIDYNVTQEGRKGMLIHVAFEVRGMKNVDSALVVRVRKGEEDYLESASAAFSNSEGELELAYPIKPGFDTAVFEDATLFLPYGEIVIAKGKWRLELDLDLEYEDGELIDHLEFYAFDFTRN